MHGRYHNFFMLIFFRNEGLEDDSHDNCLGEINIKKLLHLADIHTWQSILLLNVVTSNEFKVFVYLVHIL